MAENKLLSLVEIFNQKFFRIPDYQRGYAWTKEQLEDFWEDLENLKENKFHYTGLLTVEPIKKQDIDKDMEKWSDDLWLFEKGLKAYYIIDGQQRLITCVILLNSLLNKINANEGINYQLKNYWIDKFLYQQYKEYKSYLFGYEKDDPSDEFFKTKILGQSSLSADKVPEYTLYTNNLRYAKRFFETKLKELPKEKIEIIFRKAVNSLKFNLYEIDDELDVFITFETMNNRGKPLSKLELLKNRLIYFTTLLDGIDGDPIKLRKDINEAWKSVYEYLGKNSKNKLEDDAFLNDHWIMYFKYDRKEAKTYAKFLLNGYFTAKNILSKKIGFKVIKRYVDSISSSVKKWFYIHNPYYSNFKEDIKSWLARLNRLGFGAFKPLIMAAMVKDVSEEYLRQLLEKAENFVFIIFILSRRSSNTQNSHFYRMANYFYKGDNKLNIKNVISDIDKLIYDEKDGSGWIDLDEFNRYIDEQYKRYEGFYSWNGLRYFLYEYEIYLQSISKGITKVTWEELAKRKKEESIEHIYPRDDDKECWKDSFGKFNHEQKKNILDSLGNLLLLSQSKNSSLQNNCFSEKKKQKNGELGYFNGSYSEIEVAQNNNWTLEEIKQRGLKLLKFMGDRWNISLWNEGEDEMTSKLQLLHLDFT